MLDKFWEIFTLFIFFILFTQFILFILFILFGWGSKFRTIKYRMTDISEFQKCEY